MSLLVREQAKHVSVNKGELPGPFTGSFVRMTGVLLCTVAPDGSSASGGSAEQSLGPGHSSTLPIQVLSAHSGGGPFSPGSASPGDWQVHSLPDIVGTWRGSRLKERERERERERECGIEWDGGEGESNRKIEKKRNERRNKRHI